MLEYKFIVHFNKYKYIKIKNADIIKIKNENT